VLDEEHRHLVLAADPAQHAREFRRLVRVEARGRLIASKSTGSPMRARRARRAGRCRVRGRRRDVGQPVEPTRTSMASTRADSCALSALRPSSPSRDGRRRGAPARPPSGARPRSARGRPRRAGTCGDAEACPFEGGFRAQVDARNTTVPASACVWPQMQLNNVVFPPRSGPPGPPAPPAHDEVDVAHGGDRPKDLVSPRTSSRAAPSTRPVTTRPGEPPAGRAHPGPAGCAVEEALEALRPDPFLVLDHAFGVAGVGERTSANSSTVRLPEPAGRADS